MIGIVANNPLYKGGVLFVDSADKAARFVEVCDAFGVPLLFLTDVPGRARVGKPPGCAPSTNPTSASSGWPPS